MLGAMMIDNRLADDLLDQLEPAHFFEPVHGRIFAAVRTLRSNDMLVTPVTLRPMFEADEGMKALGGPAYLAQLTGSGAGLIGARQFAKQIYDLAMLRALVSVGRTLVDRAMDTSEEVNPRGQIELAEEELFKVAADGGSESAVKSFAQAATAALKNAERALNSGGHIGGVTTGLETINALVGGLHRSDLIILAGRPGMGKTSLATNIAFNAARRWARDREDGIPADKSIGAMVAFFSLEMAADQLAGRILSEQTGITSEVLRSGKLTRAQFGELAGAATTLENLPLYIDDTPALTIAGLHTRVRRLHRKLNQQLGMIVVDYLQLLQGSGRGSNDNRVQEISEISRGLKAIAKDFNIPVIALSQLSRAVEQREDKRPVLSDLRESGSIEQDADMVWFIFRAEYYHGLKEPARLTENSTHDEQEAYRAWSDAQVQVANKATLIVAKQRHGSTGAVNLHFNPEATKFGDLELRDRGADY